MSLRFAVVAEAPADHRTATELADRVLVEAVDWLDHEHLDGQRDWLTQFPDGQPITWTKVRKQAREAGIEASGFFDGKPGQPDAQAARRAMRYLRATVPALKAVILVRDQDGQSERRDGLEQARREDHEGLAIVIGLAIIEREAWAVCGFLPQDDAERASLAVERQNLGFDPCANSHELTAGKDNFAPRSPKRVLGQLTGGSPERERQCWRDTPLDDLRGRGGENGLAGYLLEVRDRLAPLIGHVPGTA